MVNKKGINLVLHLSLCLLLLTADVTDSKTAETQFEHYHTYLEREDNTSSVETISLNDQRNNKNVPERGSSTVPETYQEEQFSTSNDGGEKTEDSKNGEITNPIEKGGEEEGNEINTKNTTPDWRPKAVGVATWYEISLTGRRTVSKVGQWVENDKNKASSSTTSIISYITISQVSLLLLKKFI